MSPSADDADHADAKKAYLEAPEGIREQKGAEAPIVRETLRLIVRARREGVVLFARADGKLGLKADRPPSDELLVIQKEYKADILALLPPPRVERAKLMLWQLRALGFRPYLNDKGVLLIADAHATGKKRRDVSQYLPIAEVFDTIVAGLVDDSGLLDS
jgi:hypothetical protein